MKTSTLILIALLMTGCATPFSEGYKRDEQTLNDVALYYRACKATPTHEACGLGNINRVYEIKVATLARIKARQRREAQFNQASSSSSSRSASGLINSTHQVPRTHYEMMCASNPFEC